MKFYKREDATYYARTCSTLPHKVVKARHWSMEKWCFVPCYTVVLDVVAMRKRGKK